MGKKYQFGFTDWGKKWIDAMEKIDYNENRLPRGRSYAKNGKVVEININKKNVINARVQGTRFTPYKIKISLNKFTAEDKNIIKLIFSENPNLIANLLIGKLPIELDDLMKKMIFIYFLNLGRILMLIVLVLIGLILVNILLLFIILLLMK